MITPSLTTVFALSLLCPLAIIASYLLLVIIIMFAVNIILHG